MKARPLLVLLGCMLLLFFPGCSRGPKSMPAVDARNMGAYNAWRSYSALAFPKEPWAEFDAAIVELRAGIMTGSISRTEDISRELCRQIHGHTFNQVLRMAYETKLARLEKMRAELKSFIDGNALIIPKPGDVGSRIELKHRRDDQAKRLQNLIAEIAAVRTRLNELGSKVELAVEAETAAASALPREQALAEIRGFIERRRTGGILNYGDWPVQFDTDGSYISGQDRAPFIEQLAAGRKSGNTVIAVLINRVWRIYDQPIQPPEFAPAVTANLTEADKRDIAFRWALAEAENWARKRTRDDILSGAMPALATVDEQPAEARKKSTPPKFEVQLAPQAPPRPQAPTPVTIPQKPIVSEPNR